MQLASLMGWDTDEWGQSSPAAAEAAATMRGGATVLPETVLAKLWRRDDGEDEHTPMWVEAAAE